MKPLLIATSLVALFATSSAFAHDHGHHRRGHDRDRHHHNDRDHDDDHRRHRRGHNDWRRDHYSRGDRIDVVYVERRYYVDDYDHYRLRRPPHGHRWIRTDDGKFILVAVATGIIADILLHH